MVIAIGGPGRLYAEAIAEYERRARHYWPLEVIEVRAERSGRGRASSEIQAAESARLLERVPTGVEPVALTRGGEPWSSLQLARHLESLAVESSPGVAFLVGGAFGIGTETLGEARRRISLSNFTLPHELARLILTEQLYRAGTIVRGEPYHKGG